jgi:hypothetical protein
MKIFKGEDQVEFFVTDRYGIIHDGFIFDFGEDKDNIDIDHEQQKEFLRWFVGNME